MDNSLWAGLTCRHGEVFELTVLYIAPPPLSREVHSGSLTGRGTPTYPECALSLGRLHFPHRAWFRSQTSELERNRKSSQTNPGPPC